MKIFLIRSMLTIGLPLILLYAFLDELWRGIKSAFYYAWLDVRDNWNQYIQAMKRRDY